MLQKVTAGLQADNYPDIAYVYGSDLANLAKGDQLLNLSDAIDNGDIDWDRFVDAGKQAVTVDGQPRAVPALHRQPGAGLQQEDLRRRGRRLPDGRLDVGRLPEGRRGAQRPQTRASRASAGRGRATRTPPGGSGRCLAARRRHRQRGRRQRRLRRSPQARRRSARRRPGRRRRLGLHRQHRGQRAHAAALRQRQDGDEHRRPVTRCPNTSTPRSTTAWCSLPSFSDEHTTIAGPDTWAIFDNGERAREGGARVHGLVQRARAAEPRWISEAGQPAPDQRRQGRRRLRRLHEEPAGPRQVHRTPTAARPARPIPEYPQISQAMGKAVASVLYGEASPSEALSNAVDTANAGAPGPRAVS